MARSRLFKFGIFASIDRAILVFKSGRKALISMILSDFIGFKQFRNIMKHHWDGEMRLSTKLCLRANLIMTLLMR